jgi:hypothetical protein
MQNASGIGHSAAGWHMGPDEWPIMADNGPRKGDAARLLALAAGHTIRDAASTVGIGEPARLAAMYYLGI